MAGKNCFSCKHGTFLESHCSQDDLHTPESLFCLATKEDIWNEDSTESLESTSRNVARACNLFEEAD